MLEARSLTAGEQVARLPVGTVPNVGLDHSTPLELSADPRIDTLLLPPVFLSKSILAQSCKGVHSLDEARDGLLTANTSHSDPFVWSQESHQ